MTHPSLPFRKFLTDSSFEQTAFLEAPTFEVVDWLTSRFVSRTDHPEPGDDCLQQSPAQLLTEYLQDLDYQPKKLLSADPLKQPRGGLQSAVLEILPRMIHGDTEEDVAWSKPRAARPLFDLLTGGLILPAAEVADILLLYQRRILAMVMEVAQSPQLYQETAVLAAECLVRCDSSRRLPQFWTAILQQAPQALQPAFAKIAFAGISFIGFEFLLRWLSSTKALRHLLDETLVETMLEARVPDWGPLETLEIWNRLKHLVPREMATLIDKALIELQLLPESHPPAASASDMSPPLETSSPSPETDGGDTFGRVPMTKKVVPVQTSTRSQPSSVR